MKNDYTGLSQYEMQQHILETTNLNIVTCGDCGSTLIVDMSTDEIKCPDCGFTSEHCDFPDLNY
jgi:ribosomal protein S27E